MSISQLVEEVIVYRSSASAKINKLHPYGSSEHMNITLTHDSHALRILVIYRPIANSVFDFIQDFSHLVHHLNLCGGKLLILGDFDSS